MKSRFALIGLLSVAVALFAATSSPGQTQFPAPPPYTVSSTIYYSSPGPDFVYTYFAPIRRNAWVHKSLLYYPVPLNQGGCPDGRCPLQR